jgi:hypothetical protein
MPLPKAFAEEEVEEQDQQTEQKTEETKPDEENPYKQAVEVSQEFDQKIKMPEGEDQQQDEQTDDTEGDDNSAPESDKEAAEDNSSGQDTAEDSKFSDEVLARAERVGMTGEMVDRFSSEQDLSNALELFEQAKGQDSKDGETGDNAGDEKQQEKEKSEPALKATDFLDPELHDESEIEALQKVFDQMDEQKKQLERVNEVVGRQQQVERLNFFDQQVNSLGDDWKGLLGEGSGFEMDPKEHRTFLENRGKLMEQVDVLADSYQRKGDKVPSQKELIQQALPMVFPEEAKKVQAGQLRGKAQKRSGQSLARATNKEKQPRTPMEDAVKFNKEFDAKLDSEE